MSAGPRTTFVMLVLLACAGAALCRLSALAELDAPVEMQAQELVRIRGGHPILVLVEKQGSRRMGIPVTRAQGALIDAALRGSRGLGTAVIDALGGRVLRASIDGAASAREFRGHLCLGNGAQELRLEASAGDVLSLALQTGSPIVVDPALLDEAGVAAEGLHGKAARNPLNTESTPAPVLGI
jgi:bifunctional DNase/RNase